MLDTITGYEILGPVRRLARIGRGSTKLVWNDINDRGHR